MFPESFGGLWQKQLPHADFKPKYTKSQSFKEERMSKDIFRVEIFQNKCYNDVMIYEIADLKIKIDNPDMYTEKTFRDFVSSSEYFDFDVSVSENQIEEERKSQPSLPDIPPDKTREYLKSVALFRALCGKLPILDRFLLHSSVVEVNGGCYAFLGRSGAGKTTHSLLWLKYLSEAKILSGDKPVVACENDRLIVYGTPWKGKEKFGEKGKAELKGICFIEQAKENSIVKLTSSEISERLFSQVYFPDAPVAVAKTLNFCDKITEEIPAYLLKCDISKEAFRLAYSALTGNGKSQ